MRHELDFLLHEPERSPDNFRWATVTATSPIRVRFDGDTEPTGATPTTLAPVSVGDRVWVQHHGRAIIIIGVRQ